jgi:hypothetical protein
MRLARRYRYRYRDLVNMAAHLPGDLRLTGGSMMQIPCDVVTLPLRRRVRAPAREAARKIKGRGRRTRSKRWSIDRLIPYARFRCSQGAPTLPPSRRARARARVGDGNQRPWPADKVEGGARLGAGRPAGKSANTSPVSARAPARESAMGIKGRGRPIRSKPGPTWMPRSPRSRQASRSGAGRRRRWWARMAA